MGPRTCTGEVSLSLGPFHRLEQLPLLDLAQGAGILIYFLIKDYLTVTPAFCTLDILCLSLFPLLPHAQDRTARPSQAPASFIFMAETPGQQGNKSGA